MPNKVHSLLKNKLKIPMIDKKRSLNLSTSVAIILAESLITLVELDELDYNLTNNYIDN